MGNIKDNWPTAVFTMLLSLFAMVGYSFISDVDNAASTEYVDKKDKEITIAFRKGDDQIKDYTKEKCETLNAKLDFQYKLLIEEIRINRTEIKEARQ